jgi:hypothetical protein
MIWTVSKLIKEKPFINRKTGLTKAKAVHVIIVFFKFAMVALLRGEKVYLPFGSSICIHKSEYKKGELPPLKRSRFKNVIEYPDGPRGLRYKYSIIADAGIKFRQKDLDRKIKLIASTEFRFRLHQLLTKTKIEYTLSPWQ